MSASVDFVLIITTAKSYATILYGNQKSWMLLCVVFVNLKLGLLLFLFYSC